MADAAPLSPIARARSFLFVPGTRMDRFDKAHATGAGCVIVDLEDAVPPDQKAAAREQIDARLTSCSAEVISRTLVRVNAADTPHLDADLQAAAGWVVRGLGGVVLPKADPESLRRAAAALGARAALVPLVESLAGLDAVDALACAPQVARLAFGHLDFQLDLGMRCSAEEGALAPVRFALVAASRRARLHAPVDGVTVDTANEARLQADAQRARAFGFGAKLCIHPAQVACVNGAFAPSPAELAWARRVVEAAEQHAGRAFSLDGRMVDLPVVRLAQETLASQPPSGLVPGG
jgi:citrate lyase subunit beta/citryl-CoA lyase